MMRDTSGEAGYQATLADPAALAQEVLDRLLVGLLWDDSADVPLPVEGIWSTTVLPAPWLDWLNGQMRNNGFLLDIGMRFDPNLRRKVYWLIGRRAPAR